jgi:hypothetical protein
MESSFRRALGEGGFVRSCLCSWELLLVVATLIVGTVQWSSGDGASVLVVGGLCLGIALATRTLTFPIALAVVVVWSLATWLAAGVVDRMLLLKSDATPWVLFLAALSPFVIGAVVAGVGALSKKRRKRRKRRKRELSLLWALSGSAVFALVVVRTIGLYHRSGISWALAGDVRNSVQEFHIQYVSPTGPTLSPTSLSPHAVLFGLLDVLQSGPSAANRQFADQVYLSLASIAVVTVIAVLLACAASAALLMQVTRGTAAGDRRWAVIGASLAPLLGIGIGVGIIDGFTTALLVIPVITLCLCLATAALQRDLNIAMRLVLLSTLVAGTIVCALLWAIASPPVVSLLVFTAVYTWQRLGRRSRTIGVVLALIAAAFAGFVFYGMGHQLLTSGILDLGGSVSNVSSIMLLIWPLVVLASLVGVPWATAWRVAGPYFLSTAVAFLCVAFIVYDNPSAPSWKYYAIKLAWIWLAATLGLLLLPAARAAGALKRTPVSTTNRKSAGFSRHVPLAATALVTLLLIQQVSPVWSPLVSYNLLPRSWDSLILSGWSAPSVPAVDYALRVGETGKPAVIWNVTDPGNDRIANFLLDLYPQNQADDFKGWAYFQTSDISSLCDLLRRDPSRTVFTRDATLRDSVNVNCGIVDPTINVF